MRHLAVGDIHGCYKSLLTLAEVVPFRPEDLVITLGDYVDRGPATAAVLDWVIRRHAAGTLVPLRGNHEIMMLRARDDDAERISWLQCGGDAALRSYVAAGPTDDVVGEMADVPAAHWAFLDSGLLPYYETADHIFVHAGVCADLSLEDQPDYMLYWEKFDDPAPHESGKTVICGHTSQKSGMPKRAGPTICIDTWAHGRGWLTSLDAASGQYWQANERGEVRRGWLSHDE